MTSTHAVIDKQVCKTNADWPMGFFAKQLLIGRWEYCITDPDWQLGILQHGS